jgi:hypothetical protein
MGKGRGKNRRKKRILSGDGGVNATPSPLSFLCVAPWQSECFFVCIKLTKIKSGMVVSIYNPSYSGGGDWKDPSSRPA